MYLLLCSHAASPPTTEVKCPWLYSFDLRRHPPVCYLCSNPHIQFSPWSSAFVPISIYVHTTPTPAILLSCSQISSSIQDRDDRAGSSTCPRPTLYQYLVLCELSSPRCGFSALIPLPLPPPLWSAHLSPISKRFVVHYCLAKVELQPYPRQNSGMQPSLHACQLLPADIHQAHTAA